MAVLLKLCVVILLLTILVSLFKAMQSLLNSDGRKPMSHYIGQRLLFSTILVLILLLSLVFGLIEPNPRPY